MIVLRKFRWIRKMTLHEESPMCFDPEARPPIAPIAGGALDAGETVLVADDGNRFRVFRARAAEPTGAGMIILPDVRGLHPYYEDLAQRFAEHGIDAVAIDYFGRTAGPEHRDGSFDFASHIPRTTFAGLSADIRAADEYLRSADGGGVKAVFTIGFCFGGRLAFLSATLDLGLAGVVGFYGWPVGPARNDSPAPADVAGRMTAPVLGLFGGADEGLSPAVVASFEEALAAADVEHQLITYPGAPHSFFDRRADEYAKTSERAWAETLGFIRQRTPG